MPPRPALSLVSQLLATSQPVTRSSRSALRAISQQASEFSILSSRLPAPARAQILSRWFSSSRASLQEKAAEEATGESAPENDAGKDAAAAAEAEADPHKKELAAKDKEIKDLRDQYFRSVAEYRNLQERAKREQASARDFAIQKFARDLIDSVDNLDLALANVPAEKLEAPSDASSGDANKELRDLHGGLKMTERVLINTLKKHGLERFDPSENGEKFDPNLHEAQFQTKMEGKEDGSCFHTIQKGFSLNGRVVRPAKVGVVKNS